MKYAYKFGLTIMSLETQPEFAIEYIICSKNTLKKKCKNRVDLVIFFISGYNMPV